MAGNHFTLASMVFFCLALTYIQIISPYRIPHSDSLAADSRGGTQDQPTLTVLRKINQTAIRIRKDQLRRLYESDGQLQISRKHKVMFVHIPKTGGCSIEQSALFRDKKRIPPRQRAAGHTKVSVFKKQKGVEDFPIFTLVRHPCERFLSAYHFLLRGGQHSGDLQWSRGNLHNLTVDQWVQQGIRDDYVHFKPMWLFVFEFQQKESRHVMGVNEVFCQENFTEVIDWVNAHFQASEGPIFPDVPHKNKARPYYAGCQDLSNQTRRAIEKFYAMDYCIFGYETGRRGLSSNGCKARGMTKQKFTERFAACAVAHGAKTES